MANLTEGIFLRVSKRVSGFLTTAKAVAARSTGRLQASIQATTEVKGTRIIIKVKYNIYALILYYMSINKRRQKKKKGGRVKGLDRQKGASGLRPDSPLIRNPENYQKQITEEIAFQNEMEEIAVNALIEESIDKILAPLDE